MTTGALAGISELLDQAARHIDRRGRCAHCGRMVGWGVEQCRPVPSGWYCWQSGLTYDPDRLIAPTQDLVGEAEQRVIDFYAPQLTEAAKAVDEALAVYTSAQQQEHKALIEAAESGVMATASVGIAGVPGAYSRQATPEERKVLTQAVERAHARTTAAGERLHAARVHLNALERRCDSERRIARQDDK